MTEKLTHLNQKGEAHIVDVGGKAITARRAVARATLEALRGLRSVEELSAQRGVTLRLAVPGQPAAETRGAAGAR